jgi:N-acylmannosamine kinase
VEEQVLEVRRIETPRPATPEAVIDALLNTIGDWAPRSAQLGVACAGGVVDGRVTAITREVFRDWTDIPLADILHERTGLAATVLNDGQAAAWGEYRYGAGRGRYSVLFLTVSTGVGGGVVQEGRLLRGASGLAGHVGHLAMDPLGPWCTCGRRGCLEQLASGTAITRQATALVNRPLTAEDVFELAAGGEPWAQGLMRASAQALAEGIANLRMLLDPEVVILGGGVGSAAGYIELVREELSRLPLGDGVDIQPAALGAHAGLIGAAALARA